MINFKTNLVEGMGTIMLTTVLKQVNMYDTVIEGKYIYDIGNEGLKITITQLC